MTDLATDSTEVRRNVAVSLASQGGARALHLVLNMVSTLVIIRYLSPSSYGNYVMVLTFSTLVGLVADFGMVKLATREVSQHLQAENQVIGTVLVTRLAMAFGCVGVLQLAMFALGESRETHVAALIASMSYVGNALTVLAVALYVRIKQQYEALIVASAEALETAYIVVLVAKHASIAWLFFPPAAAAAAIGLAEWMVVRQRYGVRLRLSISQVPHLLKESLPLGPTLLISVCYLKLDALVLVVLRTPHDVGLYGSAYQPVEYLFLATAVLVNVIFPLVAAAFGAGDSQRVSVLYRRGTELLVAVMALIPVTLFFVAGPLVQATYGARYVDAAGPLKVLAVAAVLMTVNAWQAFVLLGGGQQKITLYYDVAALAFAAVVCFALVSQFGMDGAATATLCTSVFVLACSSYALRKLLDLKLSIAPLAWIIAAVAGLWLALFGLERAGADWRLLMAAAPVVYAALLWTFRVVTPQSLRDWSGLRADPVSSQADLASAAALEAIAALELSER